MDHCVEGVTDRFDELRSDMEDGFRDLRSRVQEMDADELRREMSTLMMIGNTQMDTIRRLRHDVEKYDKDIMKLYFERAKFDTAANELAKAMGIPFDPDDSNPAKLVRMATTVAGRYAERNTEPFEPEVTFDQRRVGVEIAMIVAFSVLVLCAVVWTVIMVETWL